jgi:uncharacterized protein DUF3300
VPGILTRLDWPGYRVPRPPRDTGDPAGGADFDAPGRTPSNDAWVDGAWEAVTGLTALRVVALSVMIAGTAWAVGEAAPPTPAPAAAQPPPSASVATEPARFSSAQLEQLVAPIALYPDPITVQVLMAATYPLEIVEAARWQKKNASLKGDELDKALESEDWDPSVESLTHFPDLLQRMSDNLDWTKDLGDAFLAQQPDVLDAVQRMRRKAYDQGTLQTTKEQVVTREVVKEVVNEKEITKEVIKVEPADPQVVYVPTYSSTAVYGAASYPAPYYPSMWAYPPGYMATASLLSFGAGMAVGAAVWGDCDWGHNDVYYNNNYNNGGGGGGNNQNVNRNVNRERDVNRERTTDRESRREGDRGREGSRGDRGGGRQKWQHNPSHRQGVRYRDDASSKKFGGRDQVAARDRANRDTGRGYDRGQAGGARPSQRPAGGRGQAGESRPGGGRGQSGGSRPSGGRGQTGNRGSGGRPSQQPAARPGGGGSRPSSRDNAFGGYGSGGSTREASARGASSRGGSSYAGRGGGGQGGRSGSGYSGGRGGGGRGGGGGGGRGGGGGGRGGGGRGGRR